MYAVVIAGIIEWIEEVRRIAGIWVSIELELVIFGMLKSLCSIMSRWVRPLIVLLIDQRLDVASTVSFRFHTIFAKLSQVSRMRDSMR
jgi:hypothetical protein